MSQIPQELDMVEILQPVEAQFLGKDKRVMLPPGTKGTAVLLYHETAKGLFCEIEFNSEGSCACATIDAALLKVIWTAAEPPHA